MGPSVQNSKPNRKLVGKVLLVEDDPKVGAWLQAKLRAAGLECDWRETYLAAKEAFQAKLYHAVITDVYLGNDEPEGLKFMRDVEVVGTPLMVMSSRADLAIAKDALNHGAMHLFEKPFDADEVLKALEIVWESPRGLQSMVERFLDIHHLTPKEKEVVRLLLKGLSNKEVADIEGNTDRTIKFHLTTIFEKCGVKSRTELFNAIFPN